jgi:tRNA-binding EMAP/Myf-like protein
MTNYFLLVLTISLGVLAVPAQPTKSDLAYLRTAFAAAASRDFEIIKDRIVEHDDKWRGGTYMLVHVRPKKSGTYQLKYSYRTDDKLYYEGESHFLIRVGDKICKRDLQADAPEWALFCLGDTVIIPLRIQNTSSPSFRLESDLGSVPGAYPYYPRTHFLQKKPEVANPLEASIVYHGFRSGGMMSRAANGGGSVTYSAVFEAKSPGRFNLGLARRGEQYIREVPVVIVKPGVPVTSIIPFEKITDYTKGRNYSSANRKSYQSLLQILQPGDTWTELYSTIIIPEGERALNTQIPAETDAPPVITALPFELKRSEDFYNWMADYLPAGK